MTKKVEQLNAYDSSIEVGLSSKSKLLCAIILAKYGTADAAYEDGEERVSEDEEAYFEDLTKLNFKKYKERLLKLAEEIGLEPANEEWEDFWEKESVKANVLIYAEFCGYFLAIANKMPEDSELEELVKTSVFESEVSPCIPLANFMVKY